MNISVDELEITQLKKEVRVLERQFKRFAPISAALRHYLLKADRLKELELRKGGV